MLHVGFNHPSSSFPLAKRLSKEPHPPLISYLPFLHLHLRILLKIPRGHCHILTKTDRILKKKQPMLPHLQGGHARAFHEHFSPACPSGCPGRRGPPVNSFSNYPQPPPIMMPSGRHPHLGKVLAPWILRVPPVAELNDDG